MTALKGSLRRIFDIWIVYPDHFYQEGGCDNKDRGCIFALDEVGNVVWLTSIVEQDVIRVSKEGAVRIPPVISPCSRQDDLKVQGDLALVVVPGTPIVEDVDQVASKQGTGARLYFRHVHLMWCGKDYFH